MSNQGGVGARQLSWARRRDAQSPGRAPAASSHPRRRHRPPHRCPRSLPPSLPDAPCRIRDLNDEINKLIREKGHWEKRIVELGGPDYSKVGVRQAWLYCPAAGPAKTSHACSNKWW